MLLHKLTGATAGGTLEFVGSVTGVTTESPSASFSITGLTGGVDTAPRVGDIVVACIGVHTTNAPTVLSSSGYTKAAQVRGTGTSNGVVLAVFYKVLTEEETSAQFTGVEGSTTTKTFIAYVWRNVDVDDPLAATTTTAVGTSGRPDAPAITTLVNAAVVIAVGAASYASGVTPQALTAPSGMENFRTISSSAASRPRMAVASRTIDSASNYNPPRFGGGSTDTSSSSGAVSIALRPA